MAPAAEDAEQRQQHSSDVEKFIALLVAAASGQKSRATVVLTVRADFYNPLIRHALLSTLLPRQQVNIPPMGPERPAVRDRDAGQESGTFVRSAGAGRSDSERRRDGGRPAAVASVCAEGDMGEAGGRSAHRRGLYGGGRRGGRDRKDGGGRLRGLTPAQQEAARRLFLRLVTPGEGQEDTRARSAIPDDPQQRDIINLFSNPQDPAVGDRL